VIYTVALLLAGRKSVDIVKDVTAEITATGPQHALCTSACVMLLLGSALLYAVGAAFTKPPKITRFFLVSQALMFAYLGCDDYFQLHEHIGEVIHLNDAIVQVAMGMLQVNLLVRFGDIEKLDAGIRAELSTGALLIGAMVFIDGNGFNVIDRMLTQLHWPVTGIQDRIPYAVEDLLKLWGFGFLFLFAWDLCGFQIRQYARDPAPHSATPVEDAGSVAIPAASP
jgi:hypothetical protein